MPRPLAAFAWATLALLLAAPRAARADHDGEVLVCGCCGTTLGLGLLFVPRLGTHAELGVAAWNGDAGPSFALGFGLASRFGVAGRFAVTDRPNTESPFFALEAFTTVADADFDDEPGGLSLRIEARGGLSFVGDGNPGLLGGLAARLMFSRYAYVVLRPSFFLWSRPVEPLSTDTEGAVSPHVELAFGFATSALGERVFSGAEPIVKP